MNLRDGALCIGSSGADRSCCEIQDQGFLKVARQQAGTAIFFIRAIAITTPCNLRFMPATQINRVHFHRAVYSEYFNDVVHAADLGED